jgi:DCN1-like protein 1/2
VEQVDVAVQAWQLLLKGRFRLLEKWCSFVSQAGRQVITDDTWSQVSGTSGQQHQAGSQLLAHPPCCTCLTTS